jgi:hypothetical protein
MNRGIIYLILNKQTNEKYIGNTTLAMNKEWVHHIERSKRMSSEPLHKAFRQYGVHNFMIRELDEYDDTCLDSKLNEWIEKYQPEYNEYTPPIEVVEEIKPPTPPRVYNKQNAIHLKPWNESTRGDGKKSGLKIRCKNLTTGICTDYNSAREAADIVTGNPNNRANILKAARKYNIAYGCRWQILEEKSKKKAVFGVSKKTEQIEARYESINAAVRAYEAKDKTGILKSLKNPGRFSWKGMWWFFG